MSSNTSTGQILGYVVGAVVGYFTGGIGYVAMGAAIGGAVGGAIDPPKGPKIVGPRLQDLSQQSASYGAVIPRLYGAAAVAGNIFWIENNALKEVASTESQGGKGGGGGGSEVTTYKYYATFALGLCEGPIEGIRRIWCSGKLIYDAGTSDFDTAYATSQLAAGIRIYKGSDTQMPDARMQATIGAANTPAYRGLAYLVFEDFDLTDYGNTLLGAQFKVEVVKSATYGSARVNETAIAYSDPNGRLAPISIKGRSHSSRFMSGLTLSDAKCHTIHDDGSMSIYNVYTGPPSVTKVSFGHISLDKLAFAFGENAYIPNPSGFFYPANGGIGYFGTSRNFDAIVSFSEVNGVGFGLCVGGNDGAGVQYSARVYFLSGGWISVPYFAYYQSKICSLGVDGQFCIVTEHGNVHKYDGATWSTATVGGVVNLDDAYVESGILTRVFRPTASGSLKNCAFDRYDYATLAAIDSGSAVFASVGSTEYPARAYLSYPLMIRAGRCDATYAGYTTYGVNGIYQAASTVKAIIPGTVPLSSIVSAECLRSGLLGAGDIDVTSLTDAVRGYRVAQVAALRSNIEPLQGAYPFDIVQSGYKVKFKRRGASSSVATIDEALLGAGDDNKRRARLTQAREMDSQLPAKVSINFLDIAREYDTNSQYAERLNTGSVNVQSIEMPLVMTATEAAQKAEILLYMYWQERYNFDFTLPPSYNALEPADVITLTAGGASYKLRLHDVNYQSNGVITCNGRPYDNASYTSTAIGDPGLPADSVIKIAGATSIELLDIPVVLDAQDAPCFLLALGRYKDAWPGGAAYKTADGGQSWSLLDSSRLPAANGFATSTIAAPANFGLFDACSRLPVTMPGATLASISDAQLFAGQNHFAYGQDGRWEIIAAKTCALQGDGSYILSNLLRGRFGTEQHAGTHQLGDRVILLDKASLKLIASSLNALAVSATYRGITLGATLDSAPDKAFAYQGVNLKPLAPVYLNGNRAASGDWSLDWIRRTRVGGEWQNGRDVPLGEASEAYEIEVYSSSAYTTLKRTLASSTAAVTYTSAQQVADFGSNQATLYLKIYQLSAAIGRGTPLTTSITR